MSLNTNEIFQYLLVTFYFDIFQVTLVVYVYVTVVTAGQSLCTRLFCHVLTTLTLIINVSVCLFFMSLYLYILCHILHTYMTMAIEKTTSCTL